MKKFTKAKRFLALSVAIIMCLAVAVSNPIFSPRNEINIVRAAKTNETSGHGDYSHLPWFSGTFFDLLKDTAEMPEIPINKLAVQALLDEQDEYHLVGARCFLYMAIMLNSGISFQGKTFHMTKNFTYSQTTYTTHRSIGNTTNPFDGTFDGNGFTVFLDMGIASNSSDPMYTGFFGAVKNAVVTNLTVSNFCTEEASSNFGKRIPYLGSASQKYVGGIAGKAEDSVIFNCVTDVLLTELIGSPQHVGAIAGYAHNTEIANCVDTTNFTKLVGDIDDNANIVTSINYSDWASKSESEKITFVQQMNTNARIFIQGKTDTLRKYFYWGIDENDKILLNSASPYLDETFEFEELLKNGAKAHIDYFYIDTCDFLGDAIIINEDTLEELEILLSAYANDKILVTTKISEESYNWDAIATITKLYNVLTHKLRNLFVENAGLQSFIIFATEIETLTGTARDLFNEIYWIWAENNEQMILENEIAAFRQAQREKLEEIFSHNTPSPLKDKMKNAYNAALDIINKTEYSDWTMFSYTLAIAVNHAQSEHERIHSEWNHQITLFVFTGIASVLVIAGLVTAFIVFRRMKRNYNVTQVYSTVGEDRSKKAKLINQKAEVTAQLLQLERERAQLVAQANREKAALAAQAQREKMEITSRLQQEKAAIMFQALKEKTEMAEKAHKEKEALINKTAAILWEKKEKIEAMEAKEEIKEKNKKSNKKQPQTEASTETKSPTEMKPQAETEQK